MNFQHYFNWSPKSRKINIRPKEIFEEAMADNTKN